MDGLAVLIRPLFATSAEYKKEDKKHTQYEASE